MRKYVDSVKTEIEGDDIHEINIDITPIEDEPTTSKKRRKQASTELNFNSQLEHHVQHIEFEPDSDKVTK